YLTWLAVGMLRAAWSMWRTRADRTADDAPDGAAAPGERPFRQALVISLFNPKAILFVVAFFVQFIDTGYAYPALSFLVLGVCLQVASALYLYALILGATPLASAFHRRRSLSAGANLSAGSLFLVFNPKQSQASA